MWSIEQPQSPQQSTPEAERRQLTVMFCDLVGSTPLSQQLDPEELREVILAYQEACAQTIRRFDGYLARYVGDGLLVYFGYPTAHEDDAARAVWAGLGILAALPDLNRHLQQTIGVLRDSPLQVRIGIHTGLVIAGDMGGGGFRDPLAIVGETPNIAARLQGLAEPDTVVISATTHRLIEGYFTYRELGAQTLKGISTSVPVYQVLGESGIHSRFEIAITTGLTPLVGRDEEVGLLWQRWWRVKEGTGQVVLLSGEPGIGKSRLLQTLKERIVPEPHTQLECRCSPYYQNSALYPVIDLLERELQLQRDDAPEQKIRKLERGLEHYGFPLQGVMPLFAALLSLPLPESYLPLTLTPQKQKERTQQAVVAWVLRQTERQPVRFDMEDLHWADPSTLELLTFLIDQTPTARINLLLTFRPEFTPPWANRPHLTSLTLSRLPHTQAEKMVTQVTGGKALPTEVIQQIVSKTDGVPLFVEELTKTVLESGLVRAVNGHYELTGPLPPLAIPATLQDSLMARLDRLAPIKEIAQVGATLGREFSYDLIHAVSPLDENILQQGLRQLVEAELLYQRGLPPQATYLFKHALIQDAAYQSLLKSRRQQLHQQIAQILEERFTEARETQPELLAHHYTEAGLKEQAIPYWQQAGERAVQRSANVEAISHLTKSLELLKTLPDTPERAQQELTLQIALGVPLVLTKGHAASEVEATYTRTRELCRQVGETPQLFSVLLGLRRFYALRVELQTARELGEQLLTLAQRLQDPGLLARAHLMQAEVLWYSGNFVQAREHLEQGTALYDPQQHRSHAFLYGNDTGVFCLSFAAYVLWILGYPDQALKRSYEALTLARELTHPFSLAMALSHATWLHHHRREARLTQERAEAGIALCTEHGFLFFLAMETALQGWALVEQEQVEEGIAKLRQGLTAYQATGAALEPPRFLALLAEAYEKVGRGEEGVSGLAEALATMDKIGGHFYKAELYRIKGTLLLQSKDQSLKSKVEEEAEGYFRKAIEIARRQSAKSWELRAVMSLARLWQQQGKKAEARRMLSEIYNWFTEGFDTADLQEAKALLQDLV